MLREQQEICGPTDASACQLSADNDRSSRERHGPTPQVQEGLSMSPGFHAASRVAACAADTKQQVAGKPDLEDHHDADHQQPRDVVSAPAGRSAFAASAGSFPECSMPGGSDAASFARQPRGVEAMMGGQRRTHSGALTSPSGLSDHGSLLVERAASSSSAHRALLGGCSPDRSAAAPPAAASALLELHERDRSPSSLFSVNDAGSAVPAAGAIAPAVDGTAGDGQQRMVAAATDAAACAPSGASRRPAGLTRPTVLIPPAPGYYSSPIAQPLSSPAQPYAGPVYAVDELDLDVIDDIAGVDACGLSASSSPTLSGASHARNVAGAHLRSSRDQDLRRVVLLNQQLLSPNIQGAGAAHITAGSNVAELVSVSAQGSLPPSMFTGSTRARALASSNNSLQSVASGHDQCTSTESLDMPHALHLLRLSRGSTPSPAPNGSPARPRSALMAPSPRGPLVGGSRTSSATASPVPPPSHGPAAALLAGSVVASPRTPHSPLSVMLSPSLHSARVLSGHGTPLPGPLFGSGFGAMPPSTGQSPGTSPGTSSMAGPGSTASSCGTGSAATGMTTSLPATTAGRSSILPNGHGSRRLASPSPISGAADSDVQQQQQGDAAQTYQPTQMQQLLRQQVMQHDTRFGPHGGSPLSPSHHQHVLPPRGDGLLSPPCPTSLVSPALMMSAGSRNGQLADTTSAAAGATPAGAAPAGRSAGGVGQGLSIHEWLDHQSWRLPYDVPQGLRDAAEVREAAAQEQQHVQSRMGPSRAASNRSNSQRNSLSNLDSPGASLHVPGTFSGLGRFPAALQQPLHHQLHHTVHRQQPDVVPHRQVQPLCGDHGTQGDYHGEPDTCAPHTPDTRRIGCASDPDASTDWPEQRHGRQPGWALGQLSVEVTGPNTQFCGQVPQAAGPFSPTRLPHPPHLQQEQQLVLQHGQGDASSMRQQCPGEAEALLQQQQRGEHGNGGCSRQGQCGVLVPRHGVSHLSSCGHEHLTDAGHGASSSRSSRQQPSAVATSSTSQQRCNQAMVSIGALPAASTGSGHYADTTPRAITAGAAENAWLGSARASSDTGDPSGSSSSSSSTHAVQLGAGSHLYPAGSPVRQGSCCYSCQQTADVLSESPSAPAAIVVAAGAAAASGSGRCSHLATASDQTVAMGASCQAAGMQTTWQQQPNAVMSPGSEHRTRVQDLAVQLRPCNWLGAQQALQLQSEHNQRVLPGVAELLQRRHEQDSLQPVPTHQSPGVSRSSWGSRVAATGTPAAGHDCQHSGPGVAALASGACCADASPCIDCGYCSEAGCNGCSSNSGVVPAAHSGSEDHVCSCGSSNAVLGALLCDITFVGKVLAALPGVDPESELIQNAVAELREALLGTRVTAPHPHAQLH